MDVKDLNKQSNTVKTIFKVLFLNGDRSIATCITHNAQFDLVSLILNFCL
jgi:hypothetical protein